MQAWIAAFHVLLRLPSGISGFGAAPVGARLLVEGGADVNAATREGETPLMNAALGNHAEMVKSCSMPGRMPTRWTRRAARRWMPPRPRVQGNARGCFSGPGDGRFWAYLVRMAAWKDSRECLEYLLGDLRFSPDGDDRRLDAPDPECWFEVDDETEGLTPLTCAASAGHAECVRLLLHYGATPLR